jgi:hypothetical protein
MPVGGVSACSRDKQLEGDGCFDVMGACWSMVPLALVCVPALLLALCYNSMRMLYVCILTSGMCHRCWYLALHRMWSALGMPYM